jgi:ubiquinone/menaquinone biosynthesis C-methylase UbiE
MLKLKQNIQDRFGKREQAERYRNRFHKGWRRLTHCLEERALDQLLGSLGRVPVAMDVACGPGRFAVTLASHCDRLLQTDFSYHMLDLSREDHPLERNKTSYFLADARHLPLPDDTADVLFCHRFLNHIHEPQDRINILRELARVTRQYVIVSCLGPPAFIRVIRRAYTRLIGKFTLHQNLGLEDLLQTATEAGLVLKTKSRISPVINSAFYLVLAKTALRPG